MSSSLLNPSKYLTDILSKYLEFDPAQVRLGIWSGDLSLKEVSLKNSTINPLLRTRSSASSEDRPPLQIKLLKSSIGNFRLQIPWKRLAWGAGDVKLEVSDVTIFLGLESAHDPQKSATTPRNQNGSPTSFAQKSPKSAKKDTPQEEIEGESNAGDDVSKSARDHKQNLLREAERLQLQGLPLSELLGQERKDNTDESAISDKISDIKELGRLEGYLKSATSSILWRIFAGLKASVRKVRIVLVRDGVEIGVILHSLNVDQSNEKNKSDVSRDVMSDESSIEEQEDVVEKQVTKEVQFNGLGCFIRREDFKNAHIPKELKFSTSVTADDYFLRPAELNMNFSIYYPLSNKERKSKAPTHENLPLSSSGSVATEETTDSSKARRGKRDRNVTARDEEKKGEDNNVFDIPEDTSLPESTSFSSPGKKKRNIHHRIRSSQSGITSFAGMSGTDSQKSDIIHNSTRKRHRRQGTGTSQSLATSISGSYLSGSQIGAFHDSATSLASTGTSRHVKIHLGFGDVKTVCTSRQYELAHIFCASLAKMRNGRPDRSIRSVLLDDMGNDFKHSITVKTPVQPPIPTKDAADDSMVPPSRLSKTPSVGFKAPSTPGDSFSTPIARPPNIERATSLSAYKNPHIPSTKKTVRLSLLSPAVRSERSLVVRSWWKYAYIAVCWELRRKKKLKKKFQQIDFVFDWEKQKCLRKEYVELYISVHLEQRGLTSYLSAIQTDEEDLLRMEDELPTEQVLLYRSIARALRVRGLTNMPENLIGFRRESTVKTVRKLPVRATPYSRKKGRMSPLRVIIDNESLTDDDDGKDTVKHSMDYISEEYKFLTPFQHQARMSQLRQKGTDANINHRNSSNTNADNAGNDTDTSFIQCHQSNALFSPLSTRSSEAIKSLSPRDAFFDNNNSRPDNRTLKTFKTAKTSSSSSKQVESSNVQPEVGKVIEYSFSLDFQSIDLMVYETAFTPRRYSVQTEGRPLTKNPSQPGSDDVSEISTVSGDFEEIGFDGTVGIEEEIDEKEFMLSSDFLLFGTPSSMLHVVISTVDFSVRGSSGGERNTFFSVSRVNITGKNNCHVLSLGQSPKCVDVKPVIGANLLQNQTMAISVAIFDSKEGARICECELSKIYTTIEMPTAMQLVEFSSTSVRYPGSLVPIPANEDVRNYLLQAEDKYEMTAPANRSSLHLVMQGFETIIPSRHDSDLTMTDSTHSKDELPRITDLPRVKISSGLIQFYCGKVVDGLRNDSLGMDDVKTYFFSASGIAHDDVAENFVAPELEMLDADKILTQKKSDACHHCIIALNDLDCVVIHSTGSESDANKSVSILESPVNMEMMLSNRHRIDLDGDSPKHQLVMEVSPVHLLVSEARLQVLSTCVGNLSSSEASDRRDAIQQKQNKDVSLPCPRPARVEALSAHILRAVHIDVARIKVSIVANENRKNAFTTLESAEVILEECITDFLSVISCFDLHCPVKDSFDAAMLLCMDRLCVLGFTANEAKDCVETARLNFLADIELMRRARTQVVEEYAEVQRDFADDNTKDKDGTPNVQNACFTPLSDDVEENSDVDSAESMDIIETTIDHAVEATIQAFLPLLGERLVAEQDYRELFVVDLINGASFTMVKLFYDVHFSFYTRFLDVSNGAGVRLVHIRPDTSDKSGEQSEMCEGDTPEIFDGDGESILEELSFEEGGNKVDSTSSKNKSSPAILYSRFEIDKGYGFGSGGCPVTVLGLDDTSDARPQLQEKLDDVLLGDVDLIFSRKLFEEIQQIFSVMSTSAVNNRNEDPKNVSTQSPPDSANDSENAASLYVHSDKLSLLILSDELAPFSRCNFDNMALRKGSQPSNSDLNISALHFNLINLTPEGQTFPDVIKPLEEIHEGSKDEISAFELKMIKSQNMWLKGTEICITINGVRVFLVRQYINELLQFFLSKEHGVGSLMSKNSEKDPCVDSSGNPPPPLIYSVSILDSSIVLPRNSNSSEMLAIEAENLLIFNSYQQSSFELPTETTALFHGTQAYPSAVFEGVSPGTSFDTKEFQQRKKSDMFVSARSFQLADKSPASSGVFASSRSSSTETEFQDALDGFGDLRADGKCEVSSFNRKWIPRINVQGSNLRIFTALAKTFSRNEAQNPRFNMFYGLQGRACEGKKVYMQRKGLHASTKMSPLDSSLVLEMTERKWEEITRLPVEIEVLADYAPHLRLLITDSIGKNEGSLHSPNPFSLDMRMSQFYLLLSVWYSNMQELPVLFPYTESQIKDGACAAQPPSTFPEYGTNAYVQWLKDRTVVRSEIACHFNNFVIRSSFDSPGYFNISPESLKMMPAGRDKSVALRVESKGCFIHIANDTYGILRLGCGAAAFDLIDERKNKKFEHFLSVSESPSRDKSQQPSWPDLSWGLDCDGNTFNEGLQQPFQVSVFMTPGWALINFGAEAADAIMFDFSPIWILLDYFVGYFSNGDYGSPAFEALEWIEKLKKSMKKSNMNGDTSEDEGLNIDFRLWLLHPRLTVPSSVSNRAAPCLVAESNTGFWFRLKSLGYLSSKEFGSTNLALAVSDEFRSPAASRGLRGYADVNSGVKTLLEGLSFGARYDWNDRDNHTSVSVRIPFTDSGMNSPSHVCGIASRDIDVEPIILQPPKVCSPVVEPDRHLGPTICEITAILELFPVASSLFMNLMTGPSEDDDLDSKPDSGDAEVLDESTYDVRASIRGVRLFLLDPVLEKHLPIAVLSVSSIIATASKLRPRKNDLLHEANSDNDLQVVVDTQFWADYFKLGVTRSWEPLFEPYKCLILHEMSNSRGQGLSLESTSPLQLNVTGALLVTLDATINALHRSVSETFGGNVAAHDASDHISGTLQRQVDEEVTSALFQDVELATGDRICISHQAPKPLNENTRVAFSFRNMTGQRIRVHQPKGASIRPNEDEAKIIYLRHMESTQLAFQATMSVVRNLDVVEVPFPGLENSSEDKRVKADKRHTIDMQLPGFQWLQGISVDSAGRKFDNLCPRSPAVLAKVEDDWRLRNALKILTEVGLENGGRLITARSPFEVRNNTSHAISLTLNPDPTHKPKSIEKTKDRFFEHIDPGDSFQIPTLLLESSLNLDGSHLGCVWIRPDDMDEIPDLLRSFGKERSVTGNDAIVGFCSRPIQIAKIVHESAVIFSSSGGEDLTSKKSRSGIQVSCPVSEEQAGLSVAPFCYVIEVRRSPLVRSSQDQTTPDVKVEDAPKPPTDSGELNCNEKNQEAKPRVFFAETQEHIHGPVAYSLVIHPPLIIENLLPHGGRFELMHASRQTVLWFADLKPGERVPVHSVGLDAPLLLSVNLGFSRTPVGEGALVHHGSISKYGNASPQHVGFKNIGKAMSKGTKQIGKTLTAISDSPDKRGQLKVTLVQNARATLGMKSTKPATQLPEVAHAADPLGFETDSMSADADRGKIHRVESQFYTPEDVAAETTVVDSIGQRLTLNIDNVRGGGGQRRISLYAPFWIVNTTEHSLRYKQEKSSAFVSGTVISSTRDGSKPVDGSSRDRIVARDVMQPGRLATSTAAGRSASKHDTKNRKTIFSGTPGALATNPGEAKLDPGTIARFLEKDLSLETLSEIAFMFNFNEDALLLGHQKLSVQLGSIQSHYTSDWSSGFSLDSVGVNQIVGMHCKEGRALEISVTVSVAPGILSNYTKLVRFTPRYILVNQLEMPMRLWQDSSLLHNNSNNTDGSFGQINETEEETGRKWLMKEDYPSDEKVNQYESLFGRPAVLSDPRDSSILLGTTAHRDAQYINTAETSTLIPFHLPDTRGERQLRVDIGYPWNLTPSFSSDIAGEYTLRVTRALDLRLIRHVTTRASPQYTVSLPPPEENEDDKPWDGELGVWFETDWGGDKRIIVKGTKRGRYSFNHTDIHVGDELLYIDGEDVSRMAFAEAMKLLKERIAHIALLRKARSEGLRHEGKKPSNYSARKRPRRQSRLTPRRVSLKNSSNLLSSNRPIPGDWESSIRENLVLTFRTVEERLRRIRAKAAKKSRASNRRMKNNYRDPMESSVEITGKEAHDSESGSSKAEIDLKVDMRILYGSIFVVVRTQDPESPPFRIENRSRNHAVFFRQRGCLWHPWNYLKPGESRSYSWEEPLKPKKLAVKVGANNVALFGKEIEDSAPSVSDEPDNRVVTGSRVTNLFANVDNEERGVFGATKFVKLEEIGFKELVPCPGSIDLPSQLLNLAKYLQCQVDTDGATRVLVMSDMSNLSDDGDLSTMDTHLSILNEQIKDECDKVEKLKAIISALPKNRYSVSTERAVQSEAKVSEEIESGGVLPAPSTERHERITDLQSENVPTENAPHELADVLQLGQEATEIADLPEETSIVRCHQVLVQVLEATGLKSSDFSGLCKPYCEIRLKGRHKRKAGLFANNVTKQKTYYVEKTQAPKWSGQVFVFDVPPDAVSVTRGHSIRVRIRNFRLIGHDKEIGQTSVHFRSLRNQRELEGWYPLMGRTGNRDLEVSNFSRGSVKLRVQWIYTIPALVDYFVLMSERRLGELQHSWDGMVQQRNKAIESDQRRKDTRDSFAMNRLPQILGLRQSQLKHTPRESDDDSTARVNAKFKFRQAVSATLGKLGEVVEEEETTKIIQGEPSHLPRNQTLKKSNKGVLWMINSRTMQSKLTRKQRVANQGEDIPQSSFVTEMARERLSSIAEMPQNEHQVTETANDQHLDGAKEVDAPRSSFHSLMDFNFKESPDRRLAFSRKRSDSLPNFLQDALDTGGSLESRVRSFSRDELIDGNASLPLNLLINGETELSLADSFSVTEEEEAAEKLEKIRLELVKDLYELGLVYHVGGFYFHRRHLSYHFRKGIFAVTDEDSLQHNHLVKSIVRASLSLSKFKSWTAAQATMNDRDLCFSILGVERKEESASSNPSEFALENTYDEEDVVSNDGSIADLRFFKEICSPDCATSFMRSQAISRAQSMSNSRDQFERACRRTLKSVLNPGGVLTIRPLMALNLPDTFTGMSVRVRYGSLVMCSSVTDGRISPKWVDEDSSTSSQISPDVRPENAFRVRRRQLNRKSMNQDNNDLPFYIEPLQTSGSLRLSIIGERLNSKVEIGVLDIPIGSAINCCIEEIYDSSENQVPGQSKIPMYTRWFPLMSPKESKRVEGDMGLSTRPIECEQLRNNQFSQYFTSCIKLAIIWDPEIPSEDESNPMEQNLGPRLNPTRTPVTQTYFNADIGRVSVAAIDSQRAMELVSISASDIDIRYSVTKAKTRSSLAIGWIQIDQQNWAAKEPVVLAPTPVAHPHPTLQFLAVRDNLRTKNNIVSYQYIAVALQEMDLTIEEAFMFDLWDFFESVVRRREVAKKSMKTGEEQNQNSAPPQRTRFERHSRPHNNLTTTESPQPLWELLEADKNADKTKGENRVYVEELVLGFIKLHLTYVKGSKKSSWEVNESGDWVSRTTEELAERHEDVTFASQDSHQQQSEMFMRWSENTHDDDLWTEGEGTDKGAYSLPNTIASVFPSVSDARIRLQGKVIEHVFESPGEIIASIQNFYVTEILKQIYKIVGSLDFVGNPTMVLSSFATGVRDFIVTPSKAFIQNPKEVRNVGVGVAKGTLSLVSHSASGLCSFNSKIFACLGQTVAQLSCDDKYTEWHRDTVLSQAETLNRRWKMGKKQNLRSVVGTPLKDIMLGVLSGVTGIIVAPYNGIKKGKGTGLAKGVAIGCVGSVIRPVVGVLDACSHFSGSIYEIAKRVNLLEKRYQPVRRLRLPYTFCMKNVLDPFDPVTARSVYLLRRHTMKPKRGEPKKKSAKDDQHEVHVASEVLQMESGVETYIVATTERIVLFKVHKEDEGFLASSRGWEVPIDRDTIISCSVQDEGHNGVALTIVTRDVDAVDAVDKEISSPVDDSFDYFSGETRESDLDDVSQTLPLYNTVTQGSVAVSSGSNRKALGISTIRTWDEGTKGETHGGVREWFRVLGEFQHRPQLSRLHNAICCITGNAEALILEKGLSPDGSPEGYTTFRLKGFGGGFPDPEIQHNKRLSAAIETIPWIPVSTLAGAIMQTATEGKPMMESRDNWLFSNEMEASVEEGGPDWMIETRARAQFVALQKPSLPSHVSPHDDILCDIFGQLDQGNISFRQASDLTSLRLETLVSEQDVSADLVPIDEDSQSSEVSSQSDADFITTRDYVNSGQIGIAADDDEQQQTSVLGGVQLPSFPRDRQANELPSTMAQSSVNRALIFRTPNQEVGPAEQSKNLDRIVGNEETPTVLKGGDKEREEGDFANNPSNLVESNDFRKVESSLDSRLDRLEAMMQQLLMRPVVPNVLPTSSNFTGSNDAMQREIADLRNQLNEQRRIYEDALSTAALRQEVADLRREIAGVGHKSLKDANSNDLRREVEYIKKNLGGLFKTKSRKNLKKEPKESESPFKSPESARKGILRRESRQAKRVSIMLADEHTPKTPESTPAIDAKLVEARDQQNAENHGKDNTGENNPTSPRASRHSNQDQDNFLDDQKSEM